MRPPWRGADGPAGDATHKAGGGGNHLRGKTKEAGRSAQIGAHTAA